MHRVFKERMKIEQHIDARLGDRANVLQDVGRLCIDRLGLKRYIDALQPIGNRPSKQRRIRIARSRDRDRLQQLKHALFILRFDNDNRGTRSKYKIEVVTSIHAAVQSSWLAAAILLQPGKFSL